MTKETNDRADVLVAMLRDRACPAGLAHTGDRPEEDHGHTDCWLHHQSADEIERLRDLVAELIPFMTQEMRLGLELGTPPEDCCENCSDCDWYAEAMDWKRRIESGELGDVTL